MNDGVVCTMLIFVFLFLVCITFFSGEPLIAIFRDFENFCNQQQVIDVFSTCPDQFAVIDVVCQFKGTKMVTCESAIEDHAPIATCKGYNRSSVICCFYKCPKEIPLTTTGKYNIISL